MKARIATVLAAAGVLASASPALAMNASSAQRQALAHASRATAFANEVYPETTYRIAGCERRSRAVIDCGIWAQNRTGRYYAIARLTHGTDKFLLDFIRTG